MRVWEDGKGVTFEFPTDGENIDEIINIINNQDDIVGIKCATKFESDPKYDLSFLRGIRNPKKIKKISAFHCLGYDNLYRFSEIEELAVSPNKDETMDLAYFPKLEKLNTERIKGFKNLSTPKIKSFLGGNESFAPDIFCELTALEQLSLFSSKGFTFSSILTLKKLKSIHLTQCDIKSFKDVCLMSELKSVSAFHCKSLMNIEGISKLQNLNSLWLASCPKLTDVSEIRQINSLRKLCLENMRKCNIDFVSEMQQLHCLSIDGCGSIPSINFINNMPNLTTFTCFDTNIEDGDLTPCMRLKFAHTGDKHHYNLKCDQLPHNYDYSLSAYQKL